MVIKVGIVEFGEHRKSELDKKFDGLPIAINYNFVDVVLT